MSTKTGNSPCGQAPNPELCPLCQRPNACGRCQVALASGPCWCEAIEMPAALLGRVPPESRNRACICRQCVSDYRKQTRWTPRATADELYLDPDGRVVFRAAYHLRRGYCCQSGCRHCPYDAEGHRIEARP